jgi:hypothetical protein
MPMQDDMMGLLPEERALLEQNQQIVEMLGQIAQQLQQATQALMQHAQATAMPKKRRIIRGPDGKAQGSVEEP